MADTHYPFWKTTRNLCWVAIALFIVTLHVYLHHIYPNFTPPATPEKPAWVKRGLWTEMYTHLVFLGATITGISNSIPFLRKPTYGEDGLLDIGSNEALPDISVKWTDIGVIVVEFSFYLGIWGFVYGIFSL